MTVKLEWLGYRMVKKNYDDMLSRFHMVPERNERTDGQTETDRFAILISRVSMLAHDKNHPIFLKFCTQQQILKWMNVTWPKMKKKVALDRLWVRQNVFLVNMNIYLLLAIIWWHSPTTCHDTRSMMLSITMISTAPTRQQKKMRTAVMTVGYLGEWWCDRPLCSDRW